MKMLVILLAFTLAVPLIMTGCDRTVEEQTKTTTGENGTSTEKKTVTESPNGTVTQTKEKSSQNNQ